MPSARVSSKKAIKFISEICADHQLPALSLMELTHRPYTRSTGTSPLKITLGGTLKRWHMRQLATTRDQTTIDAKRFRSWPTPSELSKFCRVSPRLSRRETIITSLKRCLSHLAPNHALNPSCPALTPHFGLRLEAVSKHLESTLLLDPHGPPNLIRYVNFKLFQLFAQFCKRRYLWDRLRVDLTLSAGMMRSVFCWLIR